MRGAGGGAGGTWEAFRVPGTGGGEGEVSVETFKAKAPCTDGGVAGDARVLTGPAAVNLGGRNICGASGARKAFEDPGVSTGEGAS